MSISKKIRFEVFKRDGFTCQYCGKHPPEITLEIDHIQPKSKKGLDEINNLLTACFDCNRGKTNIELTSIPNTLIQNKEILEERELQYIEYHKILARIDKRVNKEVEIINAIYSKYFIEWGVSGSFKNTIKLFINKLGLHEVSLSMESACCKFEKSRSQKDPKSGRWLRGEDLALKYFCGICWNKIKNNGRI